MASQALYLRWRPTTFDEVVGQEHITTTLRNALIGGRVAHAYLFSGLRGTGKTTSARLLAKAVNCLNDDPALKPDNTCRHCIALNEGRYLDMIEIDAASHTSVDDVRELRERIAFAPNEGQYKVYIIDEVHRFSASAFDALLKTIEEPPAHAIFILATTEIHKVPKTILSRVQRFDFRRIPPNIVKDRLRLMADAEGIQAEDAALELIARQGTGSLRDSISLLDQLITGTEDVLTLAMAQAVLGTVANEAVWTLVDHLIAGDTASGLDLINQVLDEGGDARQFGREITEYLRVVMLLQAGGSSNLETELTPEIIAEGQRHAEEFSRRVLIKTLRTFNDSLVDKKSDWHPQLPLEMAFIESVEFLYASSQQNVVQESVPQRPAAASRQPQAQNQTQQAAPAESEQVTQADAPPQPAADAPTMGEINRKWKNILRITRQLDRATEALLNSGSVYGIEGYTVILQMPSQLLCDKIGIEETRGFIKQALVQVFNQELEVNCRIGKGGAARNQDSDNVDTLVAEDSVTAFMVNDLGGKVARIEKNEE